MALRLTTPELTKEAIDLLTEAVAARCEPEVEIYEKEVAGVYADAMDRFGMEVEVFEAASGRPSVVGRVRGSGGGKSLGFNAHLMSPISEADDWDTAPYEAIVKDHRIIGSGVADAKAGIVAMLFAARELSARNPMGDLIVGLGAGGEFGGMIGTKAMVDRGILPDAVIVCEATHLDLIHRERGAIFLDINVKGETGLSGGGVNANHAALEIASALMELNTDLRTKEAPDDVGQGALNVNYIKGGTYYYNVPDRCVLYIDRRLALEESLEEAMADIERVVSECRRSNPQIEVTLESRTQVPPCETDPESTLARELSLVIEGVKGEPPAFKGIRGFTEMAHWAAAGIDSVVCGPGGLDVIHRPNEYMEISEFMDTIDVYAAIAQRFTALPKDHQ